MLVATDVDGTIAALAPTPDVARPDERCVEALLRLAGLPRTAAAVVSGRPLAWLRTHFERGAHIHLFGSHGAEDAGGCSSLAFADAEPVLDMMAGDLGSVVRAHPLCMVERKPFGVALHYRSLSESEVPELLRRAARLHPRAGIERVHHGSMVVEWSVSRADKAGAVQAARARVEASNAVFLGDDATDEKVFAAMQASDVTIKVGPGPTVASHRLSGPDEVAGFLQELVEQRRRVVSR